MYSQEREKTQDGESVTEGVQPLRQQKSESSKGYILMEKGFLGGSVIKDLPANAGDKGDMDLIPGLERSPEEGYGNPLQYSGLENPKDRGAWQATVHGVAKRRTQLSMHTLIFWNLYVIYIFHFLVKQVIHG